MTSSTMDMLGVQRVVYAEYTPSELELISGLTRDLQRVWRRRRQLVPARTSGHARFTPLDVIQITIRYALSKLGIPPGECNLDLSDALKGAMFHALLNVEGACEVFGSAKEVDCFLEHFRDAGTIAHDLSGRPAAANYLIVNEDHEVRVLDDAHDVLDKSDPFRVVFDLEVIGARLVERGRKPLVTVYLAEGRGFRTVRRLTGVGANDS